MNYKERQFGKVFVEFFLASMLLATLLITGFSFVGKTVNENINEMSMALGQDPTRSEDGEVVVTDDFLNQFGPTAAGPPEPQTPPFLSVNPDGSVKVSITVETVLWAGAILACLVLLISLLRTAFRR